MAFIAPALPYIMAAVSVLGAVQQFQGAQIETQQAVAKQQATASVFDYNAEIATQNAQQARGAAFQDATDLRIESRRKTSIAKARFAAGGVVTTAGSPLLVAMEQEKEGALAAERRLYSGELEARGFESQSIMDSYKADLARRNISFEQAAGGVRSSSATLSGISTLASVGTSLL